MPLVIDPSHIILKPVKVTFLEMHKMPEEKLTVKKDICFRLLPKPIPVNEYRSYYYGVGRLWSWLDRMVMPKEELSQKINALNVDIFVMHVNEEAVGFAEFLKEKEYVEIVYFGLMPTFIGKGIGKYFLQWVVQQAWTYQPSRIQLNTCDLDHPNSLPTYKRAGFVVTGTAVQERRILID